LNNGDIDLLTLVPPASAQKSSPAQQNAGEKTTEPEKPWSVSVKQILVEKYTIHMEDQAIPDPVTMRAENVRLKAESISTAKNSKASLDLSLLLNGKAGVSAAGTISMEPLSANLRVGCKGIEIASLQPYFREKVKMTITQGAISSTGNLSFTSTENEEMKATYKGEVSVANFSSIDTVSGGDLVKFESLSITVENPQPFEHQFHSYRTLSPIAANGKSSRLEHFSPFSGFSVRLRLDSFSSPPHMLHSPFTIMI